MGSSSAPTPQYQQPPLDPSYARLMSDTQAQDIEAMKVRAQSSTASLAARYGMPAQGGTSPTAAPTTPTTTPSNPLALVFGQIPGISPLLQALGIK